MRVYDLMTMGRAGLDLYAQQVGVSFEEVKSFAAYVGGSPTNIVVGAQRLGLRSALLSAVSDDLVGDFILHFLRQEGIETRYVRRKPGTRSGAALLSMQPPDRFPIVMYRNNPADLQLDIDDVLAAPVAESRAFIFAGTNLSGSPSRDATLFAAEQARAGGVEVVLDLDFRPDQWSDPRAFGVAVRSAVRLADIVIGTQEEIRAAMLPESQRSGAASHAGNGAPEDVSPWVEALLALGPKVLVEKRGAAGACVHLRDGTRVEAPPFAVTVQKTLGAGDAFAAGFLYGYLSGWDWYRSVRFGNACGAIIVTRHGCAACAPTLQEVMTFAAERGGL